MEPMDEYNEALKDADKALAEAYDFLDEALETYRQLNPGKYDNVTVALVSHRGAVGDIINWIREQ